MATKREKIMLAAIAELTGLPGVLDGSVFRSRSSALGRAEYPALVVEPVRDVPDNQFTGRLMWAFTFQIAVMVRSSSPGDAVGDPIVESVHDKIMNSAGVYALVSGLTPGSVDWQFVEADKDLCVVVLQFVANYQTDLDSITG